MSTTTYYRARCGSTYRITHTTVRAASQTAQAPPATTMQDRRSTFATTFSPEYPTTSAEVARLVSTGSFIQEVAK
jgi:hypothetical protein